MFLIRRRRRLVARFILYLCRCLVDFIHVTRSLLFWWRDPTVSDDFLRRLFDIETELSSNVMDGIQSPSSCWTNLVADNGRTRPSTESWSWYVYVLMMVAAEAHFILLIRPPVLMSHLSKINTWIMMTMNRFFFPFYVFRKWKEMLGKSGNDMKWQAITLIFQDTL